MNSIRYGIEYGPSAQDDLDNLPGKQRAQILRKIERLQHGLHGNIKRLQQGEATYRLRMGDSAIQTVGTNLRFHRKTPLA